VLLIPIGIAAIVLGSWRLLTAWLLLPSLVLVFLARDFRVVDDWRSEVLAAWCAGTLRLDLLTSTLLQVPNLPRQTLDGMLGTLPSWADVEVPLSFRLRVAALQAHVARVVIVHRLATAVAWATAVVLLGVALWSGSFRPLFGWLVLVLAVIALRSALHRPEGGLRAACEAAHAAAVRNGFDEETARSMMGVPARTAGNSYGPGHAPLAALAPSTRPPSASDPGAAPARWIR
jgi:hypothetical protein